MELGSVLRQDLILYALMTIYLVAAKDAEKVSRIVLWLTIGLHAAMGCGARLLWKEHLKHNKPRSVNRAMLLVSDADRAEEIIRRFREKAEDIRLVGAVMADRAVSGGAILDVPIVCAMEKAPAYICHNWVDEIYISTKTEPQKLVELCGQMGVTIHQELTGVGDDYQIVEKLAGTRVLTSSIRMATPGQMLLKRLMDIAGGLVGSLLALIAMAIVGPIIKKASPGPILFRQERIGQNGKHFYIYNVFEEVFQSALCNKPTNIAV